MSIDKVIQRNNYFNYRNVDSSEYKNTRLPLWIKNQLENKEIKILDYGCGFGQIISSLKKEKYENIYGVDIEEKALEYCVSNSLNVKRLNLEDLTNPFEFKFDIIILSHIIEHISKDKIIETLSLIKKDFLMQNGKLLISVPNAQSNTDCYWAYEDWMHTTLFTSGSIYYVLKASGFNNIEFIDIDCTLETRGLKKIFRKSFLKLYRLNKMFWNKITSSSYHSPSPEIFSFSIKCRAY